MLSRISIATPLWYILFFGYIGCYSGSVTAQYYRAELYQVEQGLPTNLTKSISYDAHGFIWIACDAGVVRFDGKEFRHFNKVLPSNYAKHIIRRKNGDLLIAHDKGVTRIVSLPDTVAFSDWLVVTSEPHPRAITPPKALFEDSRQRLWVGEDQTVSCVRADGEVAHYFFTIDDRTTSWNRSFSLAETSDGSIYAVSQRGNLFRFDETTNQFVKINLVNTPFSVCSALISNGNVLWIGTEKGVFEIKPAADGTAEVQQIFNLPNVSFLRADSSGKCLIGTWNKGFFFADMRKGNLQPVAFGSLPYKVINDVAIDEAGNYWVSSDEGIALLYRSYFAPLVVPFERSYVLAITQGNDGLIYVTEGAVLCSINSRSTGDVSRLLQSSQLNSKDIFAVLKTADGLWVGTSDARIFRIQGNKTNEINLAAMISKIVYLQNDSEGNIWVCSNADIVKITPQLAIKLYGKSQGLTSNVYVVRQDKDGNLWAGGGSPKAYLYRYDRSQDRFVNISKPLAVQGQAEVRIEDIAFDTDGEIWLSGSYGLLQYGSDSTRQIPLATDTEVQAICAGTNGSIWLGTNMGLLQYQHHRGEMLLFDESSGLPSKNIANRCIMADTDGRLWIGTADGVAYTQQRNATVQGTPRPVFLHIENNGRTVYFHQDSIYQFAHNSYLKAFFASLAYPANKIKYEYRLVSEGNEPWQPVGRELLFPQIKTGTYTLEIRALQQGAFHISKPLQLRFVVQPPVYFRWWAILAYLLVLAGIIAIAVKLYTIRLVREKSRLEAIVAERTEEIKQQKEEIEARNEELSHKSLLLEQQNHKVMSSIRYAKRIQDAMLPTKEKFKELFPQSFIVYLPKDVVSGDFYWCAEVAGLRLIAAVDCTGHGVPGAFMSLIANNLLNEIVATRRITDPGYILQELHVQIKTVLKQNQTDNLDGLDIALCTIDKPNRQLFFAGARNPLYYLTDSGIEELKADRKSIGGSQSKDKQLFTTHVVPLKAGENYFYLFSDGFRDQFGGTDNKKFSSRRFKELLQEAAMLPMNEQEQHVSNAFSSWKGTELQQDDVLVIGFSVRV